MERRRADYREGKVLIRKTNSWALITLKSQNFGYFLQIYSLIIRYTPSLVIITGAPPN